MSSPRSVDEGPVGAEGRREPRWPATLAIIAALVLYVTLPQRLTPGPGWVLPVLELTLLVPLALRAPYRHPEEVRLVRLASLGLIALVNLGNLASLVLLVREVVSGRAVNGQRLIFAAIQIWLTLVLVFGLWYWELDRGGPAARTHAQPGEPDFLFPQMATPELKQPNWMPGFLDYLYVSFTNATAFSPTDAMPLTALAKVLMMIESLAALTTIAMVAARAINILR